MQRRHLLIAATPWAWAGLASTAWAAADDADGTPGTGKGYTVSLAQMQEAVGKRFPKRYPVQGLFNLDLQTPQLQLLPAENRLRANLPVIAAGSALNRSHEGQLDVTFALRYEASDRSLRAHQLRLARFDFPTLPPRVTELINLYAPNLAEQSLREVVLHELEPKDLAMLDRMNMQPGAITVTPKGLLIGLELK